MSDTLVEYTFFEFLVQLAEIFCCVCIRLWSASRRPLIYGTATPPNVLSALLVLLMVLHVSAAFMGMNVKGTTRF